MSENISNSFYEEKNTQDYNFEIENVQTYLTSRNFQNFQKIEPFQREFIYKTLTYQLQNFEHKESIATIFNKTVDFYLFTNKIYSEDMKRGIKSLLYSKKILDKYHLNIDTKNFKNIVVKLNKKTISFNFQTGEKIKFLNRDSNICNFFIEKNMVIEKIYYEENGKILFVIYDHEIGLCKFNSFENYCYKKNKGLLQDSENYYSVCKNYEIPNFIPYAPYKQNFNCPGKYFDEKLFSYFIKSTFFNEQYDGEFIDYKVLCNNVILTQNKDREEFEISNSDLRMKGLFHISKNEQYIYKLNHKNFKIMKYDRKSKKEVLFLNLHNFNLEKIFYFYI